jgi:hypothetical protein
LLNTLSFIGAKNVPGSDNKVPINEDHAVGLEKMQIEAAKKGKPVFASNVGMLTGPFGTAENPVRVPSVFNSRVVGCTGERRFYRSVVSRSIRSSLPFDFD